MSLKNTLKFMFVVACMATVFQVIFISISAWTGDFESTVYARELYRFPLIGVFSTLPTLIYIGSENATRRMLIIIRILHFVLTASIVFGLLAYFGWIDIGNALMVAFIFLVTYVVAIIIVEFREKNLAERLNQCLDAFHNAENASRD